MISVLPPGKNNGFLKFSTNLFFHGRFSCKKESSDTDLNITQKYRKRLFNSEKFSKTGNLSRNYGSPNLLFCFTKIVYRSLLLNVV